MTDPIFDSSYALFGAYAYEDCPLLDEKLWTVPNRKSSKKTYMVKMRNFIDK